MIHDMAQVPVLVFSRAPRPGETKRRLIPALGAEGAAALHARMLRSVLRTALAADLGPVHLLCTPDIDDPEFVACSAELGVSLRRQSGADLGARMANAFADALVAYPAAIVVGSDCPALAVSDLRQAARWLALDCDAVLGPSTDGGYYLIGLAGTPPALFSDIRWGSATVLGATRRRLRQCGLSWRELVARTDIDVPADLPVCPATAFRYLP